MGQVILAAIDIETTGLDVGKHEIIDFAIVPLDDDFKVSTLPEFSIRIKADHPENAESLRILLRGERLVKNSVLVFGKPKCIYYLCSKICNNC